MKQQMSVVMIMTLRAQLALIANSDLAGVESCSHAQRGIDAISDVYGNFDVVVLDSAECLSFHLIHFCFHQANAEAISSCS